MEGKYGIGKVLYTIEEGGATFQFPHYLTLTDVLNKINPNGLKDVLGQIDTWSLSDGKESVFPFSGGFVKSVFFVDDEYEVIFRITVNPDDGINISRVDYYKYGKVPKIEPSFFVPFMGIDDFKCTHRHKTEVLCFDGKNTEDIVNFTDGLICIGSGDHIYDANGFNRLSIGDFVLKVDTDSILCITAAAFLRSKDFLSQSIINQ